MQPQRFVMLGINADSYNAATVFWAFEHLWLNHKQHASILDTFHSLVRKIRKTSMLPNIRDDTINALLRLTQDSMSYARYTQLFNTFLRRSRQPLADDS
jgi:hypothetical protein